MKSGYGLLIGVAVLLGQPAAALDRNFDFSGPGSDLPVPSAVTPHDETALTIPSAVVVTPPTTAALAVGDKVQVTVFGEKELSGPLMVDSGGSVALPLIGSVAVAGVTPGGAAERIRARYADGYLKQPQVSVVLVDFRPFYILGEVNKPGAYPYAEGLTVEQAVALAGGYTTRAKIGRVEVRHGASVASQQVKQTGRIAPGDTLRVSERWF